MFPACPGAARCVRSEEVGRKKEKEMQQGLLFVRAKLFLECVLFAFAGNKARVKKANRVLRASLREKDTCLASISLLTNDFCDYVYLFKFTLVLSEK